jgi:hypothetical protein
MNGPHLQPWQRADTTWFKACRWGVLACYLADTASNLQPIALSAAAWNERVDRFDVAALAAQLAALRVPYLILSLGQNSGHYLAPNAAYDRIVGRSPSHLSRRDIIAELAAALHPHRIPLLVYLPATAPRNDALAKARLEGATGEHGPDMRRHWEDVCREWALRWGPAIAGWWIDGPYDAPAYQQPDAPNYRSLAEALKAGNPDAIVCFNNGLRTPIYSITEYEDYTPGEIERDLTVAPGMRMDPPRLDAYPEFVNGARLHALTIMGEWWGQGPVRFPDELTIGYTKFINRRGGVVTWDVPIRPDGTLDPAFLPQLAALARALDAPA